MSSSEYSEEYLDYDPAPTDGETLHPAIVNLREAMEKRDLLVEEGETPLMLAADVGKLSTVKELINPSNYTTVTHQDKNGVTALMKAARRGHEDCVRYLARYESHFQDNHGMTALMYAARLGHEDCVEFLIHKEVRMRDNEGKTALMHAVEHGHIDCMELLVPHEGTLENNDGETALLQFLNSDKPFQTEVGSSADSAERIVETDVSALSRLRRNRRAAYLSACVKTYNPFTNMLLGDTMGSSQVYIKTFMKYLLEHEQDEILKVFFEIASKLSAVETQQFFFEMFQLLSCTHYSVRLKNYIIIRSEYDIEIQYSGNVDAHSIPYIPADKPVLVVCAFNNQYDYISYCIDYVKVVSPNDSYNVDDNTPEGLTAMMVAASNGYTECVKALIPLEKNLFNNRGMTSLMFAARNGHTECVRLLSTVEIKAFDNTGMTALMHAAESGYRDCVELLAPLESSIKDYDDMTALMFAAKNGHPNCVELLLDEAGNQNNEGMSALMLAVSEGWNECVKILIPKEFCLQTECGETALTIARASHREYCLKLLNEYDTSSKKDIKL